MSSLRAEFHVWCPQQNNSPPGESFAQQPQIKKTNQERGRKQK